MPGPKVPATGSTAGEPPGTQAHRSLRRATGGVVYALGWWAEKSRAAPDEIAAETARIVAEIKERAAAAKHAAEKTHAPK